MKLNDWEKEYVTDTLFLLADKFEEEQENLVALDKLGNPINIEHVTTKLQGDTQEWSESGPHIHPLSNRI